MLLFDHRGVEIVLAPLFVLALGLWLWRAVRRKARGARLSARTGALLLAVASTLLLLFEGCAALFNVETAGAPIYSPDHQLAIRVRTLDSGALGGFTTVELFSNHGLREDYIASGNWRVIEDENVRWVSNKEVLLGFNTSYREGPECVSSKAVHVICVPLK